MIIMLLTNEEWRMMKEGSFEGMRCWNFHYSIYFIHLRFELSDSLKEKGYIYFIHFSIGSPPPPSPPAPQNDIWQWDLSILIFFWAEDCFAFAFSLCSKNKKKLYFAFWTKLKVPSEKWLSWRNYWAQSDPKMLTHIDIISVIFIWTVLQVTRFYITFRHTWAKKSMLQ